MRKVFVIIVMLATVMTVSAQKKWSYNLNFGGELKSGNVNTTIFNTGASVARNDSLLSFDAGVNYTYGMKDKVEFENNLKANIKFDLWQYDRWSPFVSSSIDFNQFKGYYYRANALAGVKYRFFWNENCDYSLSAAYVFEYTDYIKSDNAADLAASVNRVSVRFKARQKITDAVSIKHTTFYTPNFLDFSDYAVTSVTSLDTKLSKHLNLAMNFSYEYHSLVANENVKKTDIVTSATLKIHF